MIKLRVKAICYAAGVRESDAEDVLQGVLLKVHKATFLPRPQEDKIRSFASARALTAWAGVVARNLLLEMAAESKRRKVTSDTDPAAVAETSRTDPDLEPLTTYLELLRDPVEREAMRLRFEGDGLTLEQIALRLGRSQAFVHGVLHAAIKKLRRSFGE